MGTARCPMCHQANEEPAWQCHRCGYEFGQSVDKLRELLGRQLRNARITFWICLALDAALIAGLVMLIMRGYILFPWLPVLLVTWWLVRARQKISISRHSLELIEKQQAKLPKAKVISR